MPSGIEVDTTIENIIEEDEERIIVFKIDKAVQELINYRKISLDVIWWSESGKKIPNTAIGYDEIDSNDNNSFKDSNYGWEYGTNYAGKVKTYKFDNIEKMPESKVRAEAFQFRTAESFLNSLNNKAKEKQVDISKYKEGQRIYHKKFGEGTIDKIEEEGEDYKLDINFDKVGHKRLMAKFAELEIIE